MDADIKKKWVEALRSGKYRQGRGSLRSSSDKFCCLGVLCEIMGADKGELLTYESCYDYGSMRNGTYPPSAVRDRAGLSNPEMSRLANMNDLGEPFGDIAAFIEENL